MEFEMELVEVRAHPRVLKTNYTCDNGIMLVIGKRVPSRRYRGTYRYHTRRIYAHHGLDVEEELTRILGEHLAKGVL
jgi:hypothetical protein